jgi:hypothetical protein
MYSRLWQFSFDLHWGMHVQIPLEQTNCETLSKESGLTIYLMIGDVNIFAGSTLRWSSNSKRRPAASE